MAPTLKSEVECTWLLCRGKNGKYNSRHLDKNWNKAPLENCFKNKNIFWPLNIARTNPFSLSFLFLYVGPHGKALRARIEPRTSPSWANYATASLTGIEHFLCLLVDKEGCINLWSSVSSMAWRFSNSWLCCHIYWIFKFRCSVFFCSICLVKGCLVPKWKYY